MGQVLQIMSETFPPQSKYDAARDIPDLTGKVVIVTGGNTGIGKETVSELLKKNAKVYMASRSKSRADAAIAELKDTTGKEAIFLELDLADMNAVTRAANEFKSKEPALHILFNSGGVMVPPVEQLTANGYDLQFGTNCLGHAHFTLLLIPELIAGAKSSSDGKSRVINVSSSAAYIAASNGIHFDCLTSAHYAKRKKMGTRALYNESKYGNLLFSNELAKRYADQGIVSTALNPGNIASELTRHMSGAALFVVKPMLYSVPLGAQTQLWAGTSPETKDFNGRWLIPFARTAKFTPKRSPELEAQLWDWIEEQRKAYC